MRGKYTRNFFGLCLHFYRFVFKYGKLWFVFLAQNLERQLGKSPVMKKYNFENLKHQGNFKYGVKNEIHDL